MDANGNDVMFDPIGNFIPIDYGAPPGGPENALSTLNRIGGNGFDIGKVLQILSDTERYNANLIGRFVVRVQQEHAAAEPAHLYVRLLRDRSWRARG